MYTELQTLRIDQQIGFLAFTGGHPPRGYVRNRHLLRLNALLDFILLNSLKRGIPMPKKSKSFEGFWFASAQLQAAQKADFEKWVDVNRVDGFSLIAEHCHQGYKFSVRWDGDNVCYIASMTCHDKQSPNFQGVMTSRAADAGDAMLMNVYKHSEVEDGEIWPRETDRDTWG